MLPKRRIATLQKKITQDDGALALMFGALGDSNRFRIFTLLLEPQGLCVTDLANILNLTVSAVSQHLRILEMTGLLSKKRDGQMLCYQIRVEDPTVKELVDTIMHHASY